MRRNVFLMVCLFLGYSTFANYSEKKIVGDDILTRVAEIRKVINSKDWVPSDSVSFHYLTSLLDFIGNHPIDSVLNGLTRELENREIFLVRDYQRIKNPELVAGYVSPQLISTKLKEIEADFFERIALNSIPVPEELFAGSYSDVKLIGEDELERLIVEQHVSFPDSISTLVPLSGLEMNDSLNRRIDSLRYDFLCEARKAYNQQLIQSFRDSVSLRYQSDYLQLQIETAQENYIDSVQKINNKILNRYNDFETIQTNKALKEDIQSLINHVSGIPNELRILNLKNELSLLPLRNDEKWFQWIWLKNAQNDSIGIRIENIDRRSMRMLIDESLNLSKLTIKDAREIDKIKPSEFSDLKLQKVNARKPLLIPWKLVGKAYAGFTQNYINEFWSQGGKSSASALVTFNYVASYSKNKIRWENVADLKLGVIYYLADDDEVTHRNWHKNSDNFEVNSRLGYSAFKKWYYSAEANFKNQIFLGFKSVNDTEPSSAFFSPAYLTFSAGMEYKPGKNFSTFLSPVSLKTTYVTNPAVDETKFGLDEGETSRSRIGISGKIDYSRSVFENVNVKTKNSLFINFGNNSSGEWQFLKLPDFDSETSVDFKVNQFITTQVNFHLIYDKDVESTWVLASGAEVKGTRLQVKEFFTLGFSYKF